MPRFRQDIPRQSQHPDEQQDESRSQYHQDRPDHLFQIPHHPPEIE